MREYSEKRLTSFPAQRLQRIVRELDREGHEDLAIEAEKILEWHYKLSMFFHDIETSLKSGHVIARYPRNMRRTKQLAKLLGDLGYGHLDEFMTEWVDRTAYKIHRLKRILEDY